MAWAGEGLEGLARTRFRSCAGVQDATSCGRGSERDRPRPRTIDAASTTEGRWRESQDAACLRGDPNERTSACRRRFSHEAGCQPCTHFHQMAGLGNAAARPAYSHESNLTIPLTSSTVTPRLVRALALLMLVLAGSVALTSSSRAADRPPSPQTVTQKLEQQKLR